MQDLKISLITVTFNAEATIAACIESVIKQDYQNIEYIIIDGGSTDGTCRIIDQYKKHVSIFISEPDNGIYDAMNKGLQSAHGDVAGILNADDIFADDTVLSQIAAVFASKKAGIAYGDLDYINSEGRIVRKWRSGVYTHGMFKRGWMPPHPTFYCKLDLFKKFGFYSLEYGTAADYELMLRFIHFNKVRAFYIPNVLIKMKIGGASNKSISNRVKALLFDIRAMRKNGIRTPMITLICKPTRKIIQYFNL